jgi:RHS repeat-associated protein
MPLQSMKVKITGAKAHPIARPAALVAALDLHSKVDDPALAVEVARRREANNLAAERVGLTGVGSKLVNPFGLEFVIESHVHVPTANSAQRWREGGQSDADLFPSIIPRNLSERLTSFIAAVDRCTTKTLLVLDTMPHHRRDIGVPNGHWVDTVGNGGANLLFIDAAQIHETHFAHEIGHLWVRYVDQAEDDRVMEDVSDPARLHQLNFVQSFVTDFRVNQVIAEKGFDVSVILDDQAASVASLARALKAGYHPENPREGVFMALALAAQILEDRKLGSSKLAKIEDTLVEVKRLDPALAYLATGFAEVVERRGYRSKDQIRASIDACLKLAFGYSGDGIDMERDLVIPPSHEPDFDKYPRWIEGASPQMKCEVGRIMAREDIPDDSSWTISPGPQNECILSFKLLDGITKGPWTLEHRYHFNDKNDQIQRINEINRQNKGRQMKLQPSNGMPNFHGQARRFYMAGTARFLTAVREAEWVAGEHPYAYAMNNPVTYVDPSGLVPEYGAYECQQERNPLDDPMTKKLCRALCDQINPPGVPGGRIGPIIQKQRDLCYLACDRVGSGSTKKMWCTALGATIRHLARHPSEGYKSIKNKQPIEQLLILYNAMGCPVDDTLEDLVNG